MPVSQPVLCKLAMKYFYDIVSYQLSAAVNLLDSLNILEDKMSVNSLKLINEYLDY